MQAVGVNSISAVTDTATLQLLDYRRRVGDLYAAARNEADPAAGHALWRAGRDELFRNHPQSPLASADPLRQSGLPYWPYDASLRFELELLPVVTPVTREVPTDRGTTTMTLVGQLAFPQPLQVNLDVWWLEQYAGGLFIPLRDGTAGHGSYGGGRYLLDTAKGAYLGGGTTSLIIDFNFAYHPSCRYDSRWVCPLAPVGNTISPAIAAGETL